MANEPIDEKAVFNCARSIAAQEEREAYLQKACGRDTEAMRRLLELLRIHDQEKSFLESPPVGLGPTIDQIPLEQPGTIIGPYKLIAADRRRRHGHRLHGPADRTGQAGRRLEDHQGGHGHAPGHRPLRGRTAGAGPDGPSQHRQGPGCGNDRRRKPRRPFFVMELVKGVPITKYCDEHR